MLETLEPVGVFSADDHDYCEVSHSFLSGEGVGRTVKETTVKAFSASAGVRRPGVQLLSFWNPASLEEERNGLPLDVEPVSPLVGRQGETATFVDRACLLPDQRGIYTHGYLPFILISMALLVWMNFKTGAVGKPQLANRHHKDKSLPLFDSTMDGDGLVITTSRQSRLSGLRTPISRGSSPFPSSPLDGPVLLQPDDDSDDNVHGADEESGPTSLPSSAKWEVGGWRRNNSRGTFAQGHSRAASLVMEREKEKERNDGWREVQSRPTSLASLWPRARLGIAWYAATLADVLLGRTRRGGADSLWIRCVWDGLCVSVPSWIVFGLVNWWLV